MSALLLAGARIVGADATASEPVDVLVRDGRIADIGSALAAADAERVELDGRFLMPGLWDGHVHTNQWAAVSRRLDVSGATSAAEAAAIVRARVDAGWDPSEVLLGYGFRDALWPDAPSAELLEVGDIAVALISSDVHTVWSNAALLRREGLPRDAWWLNEQPAFDLQVRLTAADEATVDRWVADAMRAASARGVTGIVDLDMGGAIGAWGRRVGAGLRTTRVRACVYPVDLDAVRAAGLRTGDAVPGTDGLATVGWYKLFTDGALNSRTAWTVDPYPDTGGTGLPTYDDGELLAAAREGWDAGIVPTIHAIGDRAVTHALDVFAALALPAGTPLPPRMEHAQLVLEADVPRFAELGISASVQPEHAMDDRDVADHHWAGRTERAFAYRRLHDAGVALELGSDAPVAPLDPWATIAAAVTRSRDGREPWHPEQALPLSAALRGSWGGVAGVAVGGVADLAILDADPHAVEADVLRAFPVHGTVVDGRLV
ncbi:MAG: amidohydrolase [Microbacteriaceae bacterium]|nr:MAG: amidohydrolase [Microbacteriaceae bacterium]